MQKYVEFVSRAACVAYAYRQMCGT